VLPPRFRRPRYFVLAIIAIAALIALPAGLYLKQRTPSLEQLALSDFLQQVDKGAVAKVTFGEREINVTMRDGRTMQTVAPPEFLSANSSFITDLVKHDVRVDVNPLADPQALSYGMIATVAAFFGLIGFTVYRTTAGRIPNSGRTRVAERGDSVITFQDVAGVDEAKDEVKEIVDFLRHPDRFSSVGGHIPKGILLVGPPGTGKTLLARSIAGEAGVPFLFASGSDFVEMYAGVGAARVRRLFRDARRHKSCIVFIDELDAVGRSRGGNSLSQEAREQTLNQLLVEMDGFEAKGGIILIAATNRPDILDPALLRPGRFDRQIPVGQPDLKGRQAIPAVPPKRKLFAPDVEFLPLAKRTVGMSGADLANVINEAALLTAREHGTVITNAALEESVDRVVGGPARRGKVISEKEKKITAYHEGGHALAAWAMPGLEPVYKVTILPRGRTGGHALVVPEDDKSLMTRSEMIARLVMAMGGRAAEELVFAEPTTGASSDIAQATKIARAMVTEYGMSAKLGAVKYGHGDDEPFLGRTYGNTPEYSHETAGEIDEEIRAEVTEALEFATNSPFPDPSTATNFIFSS